MGIIRRLWALILYIFAFIMLTFGLPISGLWWILFGDFLPWKIFDAAEYYGS